MKCVNCLFFPCYGEPEENCQAYVPMSNADRIRQKNDEDLAKWVANIAIQCVAVGGEHEYLTSEAWWLDWLKQEVEDE